MHDGGRTSRLEVDAGFFEGDGRLRIHLDERVAWSTTEERACDSCRALLRKGPRRWDRNGRSSRWADRGRRGRRV